MTLNPVKEAATAMARQVTDMGINKFIKCQSEEKCAHKTLSGYCMLLSSTQDCKFQTLRDPYFRILQSKKKIDEIVCALNDGMSIEDTSKKVKVPQATIARLLMIDSPIISNRGKKLTTQEKIEIVNRRMRGETFTEIAIAINRSDQAVSDFYNRYKGKRK